MDAVVAALHVWLPDKVAPEEKAGAYLLVIEMANDSVPAERCVVAHREEEPKPRRLAAWRRFRQHEKLFKREQAILQRRKVAATRSDEIVEMVELSNADSGLHIGYFEVVAHMAIDVLVFVSERKIAQLPAEAALAGIVLARIAVAVATPVTESLHRASEG